MDADTRCRRRACALCRPVPKRRPRRYSPSRRAETDPDRPNRWGGIRSSSMESECCVRSPWVVVFRLRFLLISRYWISTTWVEAEPAARGVKPPANRSYFHRYKLRFDWVESQGEPWWSDPLPRTEVDSNPSEVTSPTTSAPYAERDQHRPSPEKTLKASKSIVRGPSGLFTPPRSPLELAALETGSVRDGFGSSNLPGMDSAAKEEAVSGRLRFRGSGYNRRLPGEFKLGTPASTARQTFVAVGPPMSTCESCQSAWPRIYREGYICFSPSCERFWMLRLTIGLLPIPPGFSLTYNDDFLLPMTTPNDMGGMPYNVAPDKPRQDNQLSRVGWKGEPWSLHHDPRVTFAGWVCDQCGRANSRYRWEVWVSLINESRAEPRGAPKLWSEARQHGRDRLRFDRLRSRDRYHS